MMRTLLLSFVLQALVFSRQVAAQYCYYNAYNRYVCDSYYLSNAARIGIGIGVFFLVFILVALCVLRRKRQVAARNAILLQTQQPQPGIGHQWAPPPGHTPYGGGFQPGGYPMQPNPTGYNGSPQPFQPGYTGGYMGGPGGEAPKGYDVVGMNSNLQEPPRSYNPDQPFHPPTGPPPGVHNTVQDPPSYSGFSAPTGPPPFTSNATGGASTTYYTPPDTTKT